MFPLIECSVFWSPLFNSQCAFHFFGVTREKELFPNGRFSGCNLMRRSSNPKRDLPFRKINMHYKVGISSKRIRTNALENTYKFVKLCKLFSYYFHTILNFTICNNEFTKFISVSHILSGTQVWAYFTKTYLYS